MKKDLFDPIIDTTKLNKDFTTYQSNSVFEPSRRLINDIFHNMGDKDGNFIKDFQSTGFWARLFELFMFELLNENCFTFINKHDRPDFHIVKNNIEISIEASTSNFAENEIKFTNEKMQNALKMKDKNFQSEALKQYVMKIGSVLYSKLNKNYWELEWVKNKPFFIAISAHHHFLANFLPDYLVFEYLYGIRVKSEVSHNQLRSTISKVNNYILGSKTIPSPFFEQPFSENISGVIFVNTSDMYKFNRMCVEKGYNYPNILMVRGGNAYNPLPNSLGKRFIYDVGSNDRKETWGEGVRIHHNPNALYPVDKNIFKNIAQTWLDKDGQIKEVMPDFYPFNSITTASELSQYPLVFTSSQL